MKCRRFHVAQQLIQGSEIVLASETGHYVHDVLRLGVGASILVFDGHGTEFSAEIVGGGRKQCRVHLLESVHNEAESPLHITLVQALARGERMDYALQKAVELGVAAIQPVFTQRSEVRLTGPRADKRKQRWHNVVRSACEQCGRGFLPTIGALLTLPEWAARGEMQGYFLDPSSHNRLRECLAPQAPLAIVVGPEGGLTTTETHLLTRQGLDAVGLGPRVLRTETAGPTALACMQALWGDL